MEILQVPLPISMPLIPPPMDMPVDILIPPEEVGVALDIMEVMEAMPPLEVMSMFIVIALTFEFLIDVIR